MGLTVKEIYQKEVVFAEVPSKNYKMDLNKERVKGFSDELEAMKQVVFKILSTERYQHIIYSWDYGVEFNDLFGEPVSYVCAEVQRRICEALLVDSRIKSVENFVFDTSVKKIVKTRFDVFTEFGVFNYEKEVSY